MNKLQRLRRRAFVQQQGCCWYCRVRMWQRSPAELALSLVDGASLLHCTAEHLVARCEGGADAAGNVVAACWRCNRTRHRRKHPPSPEVFRAEVRRRVGRGRWHDRWVRARGLLHPLDLHDRLDLP